MSSRIKVAIDSSSRSVLENKRKMYDSYRVHEFHGTLNICLEVPLEICFIWIERDDSLHRIEFAL